MSYDIYVVEEISEDVGNMTSNVSPMYSLAFESHQGIKILDGMECKEALPLINKAIVYFKSSKHTLEKLNPENGWGSYGTALMYLLKVRDAAEDYPKRYFKVSY